MFNSFGKSPRILRFFCKGRVIESDNEPEFSTLVKRMGKGSVPKGTRAVIYLDVWKVQTSCGFGVPVANFEEGRFEDRDTLNVWASKMVDKGEMEAYQAIWNVDSLDGLTGLKLARRAKGERFLWLGDLGAWSRKVMGMKDAVGFGMVIGLMTGVASSWLWLSKRFPT